MLNYSEDEALRANGDPAAELPRDRCPSVSEKAIEFLMEAEGLEEALFDLCDLFRVPVTNNTPWFEDGDINKPIYEVGEFIGIVKDLFRKFGWSPTNPD